MSVLTQLRRRGLRVIESGQPNELWVCCPFCVDRGKTPDEEYKLGFNYVTGQAHCFRCNWSSRSGGFRALGVASVAESIPLDRRPEDSIAAKPQLPEDFELVYEATGHWQNVARKYLRDRNITRDQMKEHQIGMSLIGPTRYRIVFPIRDAGRRLRGWSARGFVGQEEPKWLHSPGLRTGFWARRAGDKLVLVEGIFDALAVARIPIEGVAVMAMLGTRLTEEKRRDLKEYSSVVLWLDSDAAGRKGMEEVAGYFYDGAVKVEYILSGKKDPGSMSDTELETAFRSRRKFSTLANIRRSWV